MVVKKQSISSSSSWTEKRKYSKIKEIQYSFPKPHNKKLNVAEKVKTISESSAISRCEGGMSVYLYDMPAEFNKGLLKDCSHLNTYTDMCPHVANSGLGQPLSYMVASAVATTWFATHQFIAEMIFHARMENHPCRTFDPINAKLFYVPFYGGLDASGKFHSANLTERDELAVRLADYLRSKPWWERHHGKDHFLVLGRTAWDFLRRNNEFGNSLLSLPDVQNMSVLTVERNPWDLVHNQHGIPYPSYFHPYTSHQMMTWQNRMRQSSRPHLFSFIGGPRKGVEKAAVRDELIKQCSESGRCNLLRCGKGPSKCHDPIEVLKVMSRSQFCLQAPGDSFTRRSTFDSVLAGCIPYEWFFPAGDVSAYSVYIDENVLKMGNGTERVVSIEEELLKIEREKVERMRRTVINLMPRLTYAHPNATDSGFQDAVDVALEALWAKRLRLNI
ncbi:xyloglucan galactosyltransferase KATAMARI [Salix suchowensis]|nr:xyloglucan galactosyltransferase KATAMARI [Salix suchowensis]